MNAFTEQLEWRIRQQLWEDHRGLMAEEVRRRVNNRLEQLADKLLEDFLAGEAEEAAK